MIDLDAYPDRAILSTREVAVWLGYTSTKQVLRMGLPLANRIGRERHYIAGDVKQHLTGRTLKPNLRLPKAS